MLLKVLFLPSGWGGGMQNGSREKQSFRVAYFYQHLGIQVALCHFWVELWPTLPLGTPSQPGDDFTYMHQTGQGSSMLHMATSPPHLQAGGWDMSLGGFHPAGAGYCKYFGGCDCPFNNSETLVDQQIDFMISN